MDEDTAFIEAYIAFKSNPEMDEKEDSYFCSMYDVSMPELKREKKKHPQWAKRALEKRRETYAERLTNVDNSLFKAAESGDHNAARLVYARFDGWTTKVAEQKIINNTILNFADLAKKAKERGRL